METTVMVSIRIHSFIPTEPKVRLGCRGQGLGFTLGVYVPISLGFGFRV